MAELYVINKDKNAIKDYTSCGQVHLPKTQYIDDDDAKAAVNDDDGIKQISIVHISDTHNKHKYMNENIPNGDILVHTGDFLYKCKTDLMYEKQISSFNKWIGTLPHKIKIVICGNHEGIFTEMDIPSIHKKLSNVTHYLQDSGVTIYGITFFGSPWTFKNSKNCAFSIDEKNENELNKKFDLIPDNTDILLHHLPPFNIHDLAWRAFYDFKDECKICKKYHRSYAHWGSKYLLKQINERIKPIACLFGHVHDSAGFSRKNNILFCNSALTLNYECCHKFDVVFDIEVDIGKKDAKLIKDESDIDLKRKQTKKYNICT